MRECEVVTLLLISTCRSPRAAVYRWLGRERCSVFYSILVGTAVISTLMIDEHANDERAHLHYIYYCRRWPTILKFAHVSSMLDTHLALSSLVSPSKRLYYSIRTRRPEHRLHFPQHRYIKQQSATSDQLSIPHRQCWNSVLNFRIGFAG